MHIHSKEKAINQHTFQAQMNYLHLGLTRTFHSLWRHKRLFLLLLLLQMAVVIAMVYISLTYQLKILENAQYILQSMETAQYDAESLQQGQPFLQDFAELYRQYKSLMSNVMQFAVWAGGVFIMGSILLWLVSHQILSLSLPSLPWRKRMKQLGRESIQILISLILFLALVLALGYGRLKGMASQPDPESIIRMLQVLGYVFLALYYLLLVSLGLAGRSWKQWLRQFFVVSFKNIHTMIPVLLINAALIFGSLYFVYLTLESEKLFSMVLPASIVVMVMIALTRLFWIACVQEIARQHAESKGDSMNQEEII